jgi:hypothetical protein
MATGGNVPDPNKQPARAVTPPVKKPAKPAPEKFAPKGKKK